MQIDVDKYDRKKHDIFKALSVKQPFAYFIATGQKKIEMRSWKTSHRGDLIICSSSRPVVNDSVPFLTAGATIALVDLYKVKPAGELTPEEWEQTMIEESEREYYVSGYAWMLRYPRPVIELPVKGNLGIFNVVFEKDEIIEYPKDIVLDKKGWDIIRKKHEEK